MAKPLPDLKAPDPALAWFHNRVPMTDDERDQVDERARQRAFWVSGATQLRLVSDVFDAMDDAIANGTTFEDFKEEIGEKLYAAWGGEQPWRVETIFRTNIQHAYNAGRHYEMTEPAVLALRPYWRFETVEPCPMCEPFEEVILPAEDAFWSSHTPPIHFNCECAITSLSAEDVDEGDIHDDPRSLPPAMEGFGDQPDEDDFYEPDLTSFPPELAQLFRDRTGR